MEQQSSFSPTEQRLAVTAEHYPAFPAHKALLSRLIRHVQKAIQDQANASLRQWDLALPEYNALMMLYGTPDRKLTASALADAAGEKSANVTRLTNGLVARGLIARADGGSDRRVVYLSLTAEGIRTLESLLPAMSALVLQQTSRLEADEHAELERLLKKVLAGIEA
ncbi:MarR family transcriptional regulator [Duganella callida]|uniref:MarR family transcriptional regulator n=1 Tax=Duganella callida TaxID=2561932 RepID=A0A4Y9SI19_9BURK|nr:MarR family transcriptional regulator [Duganella callida]TFW21442.1 MarR family transcriptional regulator [Duganella callida]